MSATHKINALGLVFLLIGIFSFAIPSYYIYAKGGTDDFYIVTSNVNGIETTEYKHSSSECLYSAIFLPSDSLSEAYTL